jgi:AraC-like DNA-binding protein
MVIHSDDQQLELDGHRLALIPPHTDFSGELRRPCRHFTFPFTLNEAYSLRRGAVYAFDLDGRPSPAELQSRLAPLADASVQAGAHVPPGLSLFINGLITAALARIPSADWADGPVDPRVAAAQARLRQACTAPPSNDELAAQAGLHRASFIRLFKAHAGVTPQRYALRLRLEGACEELLLNQSPVEAVASRWGFSDRQHLTKLMRQHCHCTPGSLRQALL